MNLLEEIQYYWNHRYTGYSKVNQKELEGIQRERWKKQFKRLLPENQNLKVLDIGTGPGFFSIILEELGYSNITGVDYSYKMLEVAKENIQKYGKEHSSIQLIQMDAQNLEFEPESFDIIVSRNLTWNLQNPQQAYSEWLRVLKPYGALFIFDANWYSFLQNEQLEKEFEAKRQKVIEEKLEDYWQGEGVDEEKMTWIVQQLPLTYQQRPQWDIDYFSSQEDVSVETEENFGDLVWNYEEQLNYGATPMFCIKVVKGDA
ncbi:class I SAM-dependent methyltransferase [uncultured Granulicatella sp.]|uniref:class I SAM-dependent methyltransferase n=1 Tax=uncultured Granulicatella sp. TaxID=316089 RepID=UPI0028E67C4C|nr:class I SAM-dependent methyltransferase [uncultured Granulicatella sp.]